MADDISPTPHPFDVRTIRYLVQLMGRHDLSEVDLREGEQRIRLVRGPQGVPVAITTAAPTFVPAAPTAAPVPTDPTSPAKPAKQLLEIKSPTPGTFYTAANPKSEPFVRVGSKVTPTTVVCIIEAMKIFNEINAECAGIIAEVCVENQQPVEWGQVLFRVDPAG